MSMLCIKNRMLLRNVFEQIIEFGIRYCFSIGLIVD